MGKLIDLSGERFGRLTVIEFVGLNRIRQALWKCKCDCGNEKVALAAHLKNGHTKSCGCFAYESHVAHGKRFAWCMSEANKKHLGVNDRLYTVWANMKTRCFNKNNEAYERYGGRGITICNEWLDYAEFKKWALSSGYDETAGFHECTIDRIDNNKGYYPENCRWVSAREQSNNRGDFNILLEYGGETHNLAEWSKITGIEYAVLRNRIKNLHWDAERALTEKVRVINRKGARKQYESGNI